ncbi:MAG: NRDE family protein [Marinobacter sp.]|uniref:NRDE family protein n=1 Tax=Marinobacter sp. TaxID=50741 RepID=UPI00299D0AD8|nr:NRDE family protein [Marinobacter sp.]MDX1755783.1 NRDE family protein [Marinobacter sp.]
MCLIIFSLGQHPDFPLLVAANRDEFHQRPTAAMDWWSQPDLLAGRDLKSGGTWLAIDRAGQVAAVTNVREGTPEMGRHSRGELPVRALTTETDTLQARLTAQQDLYSGFNLVKLSPLDHGHGWYYSNRDAHPGRHLHRGSYGLSNHLLQSPWPKLLRLRNAVASTLADPSIRPTGQLHAQLIEQLQDPTPAPDHVLPDTGVGLETERFLSSPFIVGPHYGTRATTIVTVRRDGEITVTEQAWTPQGQPGDHRQFCWQREPLI